MRKGRPLFVEGRLKFDQWESEGQKRSKLGVILDKFEFIGGREDSDGGQSGGYDKSSPPARTAPVAEASASAAAPAAAATTNFSNDNDTLDEDVPF